MSTYKPGDWLIDIKGNQRPLNTIFKVEDEYTRYRAADVRSWQPEPGEWCWFYNDIGNPIFAKFERMEEGICYKPISYSTYFEYCEPFIGQLPSICKEC